MEKFNELVLSFFKRMDASCIPKGEYLIVDNVDNSFQEAYGKKVPYMISFSEKDGNNPTLDCFYPGTKLFKVVMSFLNKDTSTTILKINLEIDPLVEIEKSFSLKNCRIKELKKDYENNFFSRFTFKTNFIYLNKNEELTKEVFVHDGKIILGNLNEYSLSDGDLQEVDIKYMEKDYNLAKENVREFTQLKVREISSEIYEKLNKEIKRIQEHYNSQKRELLDSIEKNKKKLMEIKYEPESPEKQDKIARLNKLNSEIIIKEIEKLNKEENFTIQDEKQKHAISMNTKLINTTVLYYPIYKLDLILEDGRLKKTFQIHYDPLTDTLKNVNCYSCKKEMNEVALCSAGHVCCPHCLFRCGSCGGQFCESCLKEKCNSCGSPICAGCQAICKGCKRTFCKEHIREDNFSKEEYCLDCLSFCSECSKTALKKDLIEITRGKRICITCQAKTKKDNLLREIFK